MRFKADIWKISIGISLGWWTVLAVGCGARSADKMIDAAGLGQRAEVLAEIDKGADVNGRGYNGWTVLMLVSRWGYVDAVQALLAKGADVNAKAIDGETALMAAAQNGDHADIVKALLDKGADVNLRAIDGETALIKASDWGYLDVVQALLAKGADVNAKAVDGETALMAASANNHNGDADGAAVRALLVSV